MKVYERMARAFAAEGVTHLFGMMGDGNMYWMDALDKVGGVKMLEVRHEGVGLGMADGWARHTHTPGVCTATCGPGVTQLATALVTAARAESPIVAFVGEYPSTDQEYIQRFDQSRFAAACEAGFVRVHTPDYADEAVRKAFYLAKLESRPILLSAPMDVQQKPFEDDEPYKPSSTLLPKRTVRADPGALEEAADIIAGAKKPVIVVGRGAMWSGAGDAVIKLGERIGALVATTLRAKNWLADKEYHAGISGLYATRTAIQLFEEADVVIAVGASMNRYTTEHGYLYPNARYVHLDSKPHVVMGGGGSADCYVQTDAKAGVEALNELLAKRNAKSTGYRTGEVMERLSNHYEDRTQFEIEPGSMDPREVCRVVDETVPGDVGLLTGQRRELRLLDDDVPAPAAFHARGAVLRLHRTDAARRDGHVRRHGQQAHAAGRRRCQHDDAYLGLRYRGALQDADPRRRPQRPGARLGVSQNGCAQNGRRALHHPDARYRCDRESHGRQGRAREKRRRIA